MDFKKLVDRLAAKGIVMLEADLKILTKELFGWAKEEISAMGGPVAGLAGAVIPSVEGLVLGLEDKIDGVAGN